MNDFLSTLSRLFNPIKRIRVVVLGSPASGKTVFLTALATHIEHHRAKDKIFNLEDWEAHWDPTLIEGEHLTLPEFPHREYAEALVKEQPKFPEKTKAMSVLKLPFRLHKGEEERRVVMELLDLPGERVADLGMAEKDYRAWSQWLERIFDENGSASYRTYLEAAAKAESRDDLFAAYKAHLLREYDVGSIWITPSFAKLDQVDALKFRERLSSRPLGLDKFSQFVPLPSAAFEEGNPLGKFVDEFSASYSKYRAAIVQPIRDWISDADELVYLVDVLKILNRGVGAYNAEALFGGDILKMFRIRKTGYAFVDWLMGLFETRIRKACLIATKADIAYREYGRNNMVHLADDLLGKAIDGLGLPPEAVGKFPCSAVNAFCETHLNPPEKWPSDIEWRDAVKRKEFFVKPSYPHFESRIGSVPPQIGLDTLTRFLLKDML